MKYKLTLITVLIFSATFAGCGGATEKKETEPKTPAASSNTNLPTTAQPAGTPKGGDADDIRSTPSNTVNSNRPKSGDSDDKRSVSNARNSNRPLKRGDADDRGKQDSDGDNDHR